MKLDKFINELKSWYGILADDDRIDVSFVGIKWQDEMHPSAEEFPIDFVSCSSAGKNTLKIKFVTKPHNK